MNNTCLLPAALLAALVSCSSGSTPAPQGGAIPVERFDLAAARWASIDSASRAGILAEWPDAVAFVTRGEAGSPDSLMALYSQSQTASMFTPLVEERFPDLDPIELALGQMAARLAAELPDFTMPALVAVVSPYNQSVILTDSAVLVGLNHYLGAEHPAYSGFPEYVARLKTPARLPMDVGEALVRRRYPFAGSDDATLLSRMLYEGAVARAVADSPAEALGYDGDELEALRKAEPVMWQQLAERRMLYSTDPDIAARMISPAPSTSILGSGLPGRAGRFIGWEITGAYLDANRDATVADLLDPSFYMADDALLKSRYRP